MDAHWTTNITNTNNIVKYILRAGKKTEEGYENKQKQLEDLNKAKWYLSRLIEVVEKSK